MRVHRGYGNLPPAARGGVVTIGNFDGVHRGHRALIDAARARARTLRAPLGVVTFEPHPREVLTPAMAPARITSLRAKARLLATLGVEHLFALAFTPSLRGKSPEAFVRDVLADGLGARHVVVGYDFRFGCKRAGDVAALARLGHANGFEVTSVEPVTWRGEVCSSSRIRAAVQTGEVARAADLLGHPFVLEARVTSGDQRGRALGYPTANLRPYGRRPLLPAAGVYAVRAALGGADGLAWHDAVASLGTRPTFDGHGFLTEVHLLDRTVDLYGRRLWCSFIDRFRDEERFGSVAALVEQMARDCDRARQILARTPPVLIH